jgi:hypothetical protein
MMDSNPHAKKETTAKSDSYSGAASAPRDTVHNRVQRSSNNAQKSSENLWKDAQ